MLKSSRAREKTLPPDERLKIALLTYSTKPRGGVIHTLELAEALHACGHEVCVFALDKDRQGFCRPLSCEAAFVPAPPVRDPRAVDRVVAQRIQDYVKYFSERRRPTYDIYHAQDCISANALARLRDRQIVTRVARTVHHIDDYPSPYLEECQRRGIEQPDACFCVSRYWQARLQERYGVTAQRVFNGVDTQRFSATSQGTEASLKASLGLEGSPLLLTVGGIEPRKNSLRLLQAFARVRDRYPGAQLAIAGGISMFDYSAYRAEFFALARELGLTLGKAVVLVGAVADERLPALYRCADTFVFPSVVEGWGLVVMEAIASGLPVVTSDREPFTEFLSSQQAFLVDPDDPGAIAAGITASLGPDAAARVEASQSICQQYTWKNSAAVHVDHYQQLVAACRRPR